MDGPISIQICRKAGCEDIPLPRYIWEHAAGMDLCAACEAEVVIAPGTIDAHYRGEGGFAHTGA